MGCSPTSAGNRIGAENLLQGMAFGPDGDLDVAGVVAEDYRVAQDLVHADAAIERAFGGDPHRVGCTFSWSMPKASRCARDCPASVNCLAWWFASRPITA